MSRKKKIFIVDDDPSIIELLKEYFADDTYEVIGFLGAAGVLKAVEDQLPDLVLLDVMMPGIDGYDICYELKNTEITKHIPILLCTGIDLQAIKSNYKIINADDYIIKPFTMNALENKISALLKN